MAAFETLIALRYLRSKRKEGFISLIAAFSLLGICLGVATLIVVMAVMNGFHKELLSRVIGINGHITVSGVQAGIDDYDTMRLTINKLPGVESAIPYIEGQVMATANEVASGAIVKGMSLEDLKSKSIIADNLIAGTIESFSLPNGLIIGKQLALSLGVNVGDSMTLISPQGTSTPFGMVPRLKTYSVVGLFEVGMFEYDNTTIFMPLKTAQTYFKLPNMVSAIEVLTDNMQNVDPYTTQIRNAIGPWYYVTDWQTLNSSFFNAIKVERNVMFLILTLIILVAAFNIISSLTMLVQDKARNIAIMRTIGATRFSIMKIFFICGSTIGVTGTLLGTILGVLFALNIENIRQFLQTVTGTKLFDPVIYFLSELPAELTWSSVVSVIAMALALSFLATIPPAYKAARYSPAEALRYE